MATPVPQKVLVQPKAPKVAKAQTVTPKGQSRLNLSVRTPGRPKMAGTAAVRAAKKGK